MKTLNAERLRLRLIAAIFDFRLYAGMPLISGFAFSFPPLAFSHKKDRCAANTPALLKSVF